MLALLRHLNVRFGLRSILKRSRRNVAMNSMQLLVGQITAILRVLTSSMAIRCKGHGVGRRLLSRVAWCLLLVALVPGCSSIRVLTFSESEKSGHDENQIAQLYYFEPDTDASALPGVITNNADSKLRESLAACGVSLDAIQPKMAPALVPIVAAAAQVGFVFLADELASKAEVIKQEAMRTYDATIVAPPTRAPLLFNKTTHPSPAGCLLFFRGTRPETVSARNADPTEVGMILVIQVNGIGDGLVFIPTYLKVDNAAAKTSRGSASGPASITTSIVIALKTVRPDKDGPTASTTAADTMVIHGIPIATKEPALACAGIITKEREKMTCMLASHLQPRPPSSATAFEISLAVLETGSPISDAERAVKQAEVLKTLLGPAIAEGIKISITPDDD